MLTSGLVKKFSPEEVQAILAHELVHIITHDTRLIFLTSSVTKLFDRFSRIVTPKDLRDDYDNEESVFLETPHAERGDIVFVVIFYLIFKLGTIGSLLPQVLISRKRIYSADAGAVELTKDPQNLISALNKIDTGYVWPDNNPAYIYNGDDNKSWFSTRPSITERIKAITDANRLEENVVPVQPVQF